MSYIPEAEQKQTNSCFPLEPHPFQAWAPSENHSFVLKEEQKYSNKSNKELLVL